MQYFWYDFETFGASARSARPVQFAGVRTDDELNEIEPEQLLYCHPVLDQLPEVRACLVHGISPQRAEALGKTEHEFATEIHGLLSRENTCAVGFNAMKFDHEVVRFLLYRNLRDPYRWHWANGNARWDVIDLFRMAFAFRRGSFAWCRAEDGRPSFKLADLARANNVRQWAPHQAHSDVQATLGLARLMRERHPDLFEEYLRLTDKRATAAETQDTFIYVSGSVLWRRLNATIMARLCTDDKGRMYAFDLSFDPHSLIFDIPDEDLLTSGSVGANALCKIKLNAAPFVRHCDINGPVTAKSVAAFERVNLSLDVLRQRHRLLRANPGFARRVQKAFEGRWQRVHDEDVDVALYDRFIGDRDRKTLDDILKSTAEPSDRWERSPFEDQRLPELVFRFRARNFPGSLSRRDARRWRDHCRRRILLEKDQEGLSAIQRYTRDIATKRQDPLLAQHKRELLDDLEAFGKSVQAKLGD